MSEPISRSRAAYHRAVLRGEPDRFEVDTAAGAREAARTGRAKLAAVRSRGVDWVRPSDLIARGGSRLAWRPMDFQARQGYRLRSAFASPARVVSGRVRLLPPVSAFGRSSSSPAGAVRGSVGMG